MRQARKASFRRILAVMAALALLATACGGDDDDTGDDTTTDDTADDTGDDSGGAGGDDATDDTGDDMGDDMTAAQSVGLVFDIGGRGDQSFNDAAARGLDQAAEEFGIETQDLEPAAGGENREELLRLLAEQEYPLIFGIGFAFADSVGAVAQEFPDTTFAIVDAVVDQPNVASLVFAEEEGSFLVGAAAALKSETGRVGFIGGVEVDLIKKFEAGFVAGAEYINPDIEVDVKYITQPPDFAGFNDPAKGKEIALGMYADGADVVYHAAGGSGSGLFEAAKEVSEDSGSKVWAIGVDSDQYLTAGEDLQEYILTSMLKRVDVAVFDTISSFVSGEDVTGTRVFDLEADGVGYATSGGFVDDISDQLDDIKAQIVAGDITVPSTVE